MINILIADDPPVWNGKLETLQNLQQLRTIFGQTAKALYKAIESKNSAEIKSILENDIKQFTEILPNLQDSVVSGGVQLFINEAQDIIKELPTLADGGAERAKAYLESTLNAALFAYIEGSIVEVKKEGNCQHQIFCMRIYVLKF